MENGTGHTANKGVFDRLFKLQTGVNRLILEGKRNPVVVAGILQQILDGKIATNGYDDRDARLTIHVPLKKK